MADENESGSDDKKKGGKLGKLIVWGLVFVMGAGTGVAVPLFVLPSNSTDASQPAPDENRMDIPEPDETLGFVDFDEVVVNLNDSRYSRYLTCTFSLQVSGTQKEAVQKLVDDNNVVLKNWLIAHLRDKKLEDVRGKLGHNLLRREIHDKFNEMLFTDGIERIQDVLFQDFKVQ
ncbi:flagellar basal body-associated FliL family protein [Roseiconus lacunae]|uniref:Flagellar protein FliL n=1 Tax=Roseiconus lacunae TaxID=2605694 RepID=A0ABT7PJW3_9BACT|nr:flagellar basal body-associated FliL family protein [Roseiconus lacunae]MDM4016769.1 flagellar basal body-associated FliL family protein [Roseiconus lacunae]WRQ50918.1 flagellar basal body-associated FliL family protein [Stieleria sp. HD01]